MCLALCVVQGILDEDAAPLIDLAELKKEKIEMLATNLREPKGNRMHHPGQDKYGAGRTVPKPGLRFGIKCQQRILVASELMKFYRTIDRAVTAGNIR